MKLIQPELLYIVIYLTLRPFLSLRLGNIQVF